MSSSDENDSEPQKIKKIKYTQKYKEVWEKIPEFKGWLQKSRKNEQFAYCKCCDKEINIKSGKDSLIKHCSRNMHKEKCKQIANQQSISSFMKPVASGSQQHEIKEGN